MSIGFAKDFAPREHRSAIGPRLTFIAAILAVGVLAIGLSRSLTWDYVLPLVATAAFVLAAFVAVAGWRQRHTETAPSVTYWDVAGALTLVGICTAALIEPEQMMRLFDARLR